MSYGFRFVQMVGELRAAPAVADIDCWEVHTDLETIGTWSFPATAAAAGDDEVEAALVANYNATISTAAANWISFPTDCPHRERRGERTRDLQ